MDDVERITITERREAIMQALYGGDNPPVEWPRECADVVLAMLAAERVRVVDALTRDITALSVSENWFSPSAAAADMRKRVLAVVEAARGEATT